MWQAGLTSVPPSGPQNDPPELFRGYCSTLQSGGYEVVEEEAVMLVWGGGGDGVEEEEVEEEEEEGVYGRNESEQVLTGE